MAMETALGLRERLDVAQERLFHALSGVTEEQFKRRPPATEQDPHPWSIAEVLAHMLWADRLWSSRINQALQGSAVEIEPSDPEEHESAARAGRVAPVPQMVHGLLGARREVDKLIEQGEALGPTWRERGLWHPRTTERLTVAWMLDKIASHHEEHCEHVEALREVIGVRGQTS
jgi:hypothetical protein